MADSIDILVAEDNEINQMVYTFALEDLGYRFEIVEDGASAVAHASSSRPPLILMDISMPGLDGLEATRRIRADEAENGGRSVIIAVTAHALRGDEERCREAGADDYMAKPISPEKLVAKIRHWMAAGQSSAAFVV